MTDAATPERREELARVALGEIVGDSQDWQEIAALLRARLTAEDVQAAHVACSGVVDWDAPMADFLNARLAQRGATQV